MLLPFIKAIASLGSGMDIQFLIDRVQMNFDRTFG